MHFDEYERGRGALQKEAMQEARRRGRKMSPTDVPRLFVHQYFERDGDTIKLHILDMTVDVAAARAALSDVAEAVVSAIA